jgi:hypothetical protein
MKSGCIVHGGDSLPHPESISSCCELIAFEVFYFGRVTRHRLATLTCDSQLSILSYCLVSLVVWFCQLVNCFIL